MTRVRLEGGLPLCTAEFPYPLETLTLKPGETLVLITDGVTEAQNAHGACLAAIGIRWTNGVEVQKRERNL